MIIALTQRIPFGPRKAGFTSQLPGAALMVVCLAILLALWIAAALSIALAVAAVGRALAGALQDVITDLGYGVALMLQGDHTKILYRKVEITPAK